MIYRFLQVHIDRQIDASSLRNYVSDKTKNNKKTLTSSKFNRYNKNNIIELCLFFSSLINQHDKHL